MAEDIVEDVGLGEVVELLARADLERRGEAPLLEASKELRGRNEPADADRGPSGARAKPGVHIREIRDTVR